MNSLIYKKTYYKKAIIKVAFEYNVNKVCNPDRNGNKTQIIKLHKANIQIAIGCRLYEFKFAFCGARLIGVLL